MKLGFYDCIRKVLEAGEFNDEERNRCRKNDGKHIARAAESLDREDAGRQRYA